MRYLLLSLVCVCTFFSQSVHAQTKKDISFTIVDTPPRYPGCKGANANFLKECFRNSVEALITDNFDFKQFESLLPKGNHRVFVQFRILEDGTYDQLSARTPYNSIEKETLKVLSKLPRFKGAMHKDKPRNALFATAFTVVVNEGIMATEDDKN
ncbi:hypothetical protein DCS32_08125 [Dokdonia sp. Dokd-P16]|uniref:hypothetical protein n=1 Tax=Dokdonia sp. Dokd-P16 TaxID=2173169 RepID=UPI000D54A57D|nr:hypothetical protein [Dokdonia sp. Dokd-P16]AWH74126.1 hypothetical protein DCS32_08125 [Dokdonia sp. Dokd-P16]